MRRNVGPLREFGRESARSVEALPVSQAITPLQIQVVAGYSQAAEVKQIRCQTSKSQPRAPSVRSYHAQRKKLK
jgi:hypothetical protein